MFDEILGVPAHPLLIHAAVVFVPLLVLASLAYALVPFVRRRTWWLVVGLAVVAPVSAWFATLSGNRLRNDLADQGILPEILVKIDQHRDYGDKTLWATIGLAVLAVVLVGLTMWRNRAASGDGVPTPVGEAGGGGTIGVRGRSAGPKVLTIVLIVAMLFFAGASAYYVFQTGHTGAKVVWG